MEIGTRPIKMPSPLNLGRKDETDMEKYCEKFMSDDFTQCMYMLRHYDSINWEITKYTVTEMLVAVGACWSIYNWSQPTETKSDTLDIGMPIIAIICFASFLFGILALLLIGKNRSYFALTSRHINEYRKHALSSKPLGFENTAKYWNDPSYPKTFDKSSTQMYSFYLIAIFSVSMLGFGTYVFLKCIENPILWLSITLPILVLVLIIVLTRMYMKDEKII